MEIIRAQLRPGGTTATTLYQLGAAAHDRQYCTGPRAAGHVRVCNTTSAAATFRICIDPTGDTFDEETAQAWDVQVRPGDAVCVDVPAIERLPCRIGVRTSIASALTFTYIAPPPTTPLPLGAGWPVRGGGGGCNG